MMQNSRFTLTGLHHPPQVGEHRIYLDLSDAQSIPFIPSSSIAKDEPLCHPSIYVALIDTK
jgi:hypothetical protein